MCQILCIDGDQPENLQRIATATTQAAQMGADIACFPETAILGWLNPIAHTKAHPIPGQNTHFLTKIAQKNKVHISIGLAEKHKNHLYDSAILIDQTGKILLKHRKINLLTELMSPPYSPGTAVNAVKTRFGTIGLLICADTFRPDILAIMRALNPDIVLVPYGWAAPVEKWPDHGKNLENTVKNAAKTIKSAVIGTDLVGEITNGPWKGQIYGGQSIACDKTGKVLGICADRVSDIKIITVFGVDSQ